MKHSLRVGDKVGFAASVVARTEGHAASMRGTIVRFSANGQIAFVECGETFISEDGRTLRGIPTHNLRMMDKRKNAGLPPGNSHSDTGDDSEPDQCPHWDYENPYPECDCDTAWKNRRFFANSRDNNEIKGEEQ